jgi:hypothetical protein
MMAMLRSIYVNSPDEKVALVLINCEDDYASKLIRINPSTDIRRLRIERCGAVARIVAKREFVVGKMKECDLVAWIDNDAIVREHLDKSGFWNGVGANDVKIWEKDTDKDTHKFQAGVYVSGCGNRVRSWLEEVIRNDQSFLKMPGAELDGHGCPYWMTSQKFLYTCFRSSRLGHIQLDTRYNDCQFNKESAIWHCKSSHFNEAKFQKEWKRYYHDATRC